MSDFEPRKFSSKPDRYTLFDVRTLTTMSMLVALAYAAMAVCKLFIPKVGGFLSLDVIDAVIGIGGFLFGPAAAVMMIVVEAFIEAITLSTTGWYGFVMNVLSTVLLICPAVIIYRHKGKTSGAVIGLCVGVVFRLLGMIVFNYIVTPMYFGMPRASVVELMPIIAVFNLVKGALNAALLMILYPPVSKALRKIGLVAPSKTQGDGEARRFSYVPLAVSLVVLVIAVLAVLKMLKVI
ncbi:MAG: ECF transporter S component [Oscillospiraceae bacterium]|jgi:riboflavin transporter FmnP